MALIKHKYSDKVLDFLWKAKNVQDVNKDVLVVSVVKVSNTEYAIRAVEESKIVRNKGEVVLADNRTLKVFLNKFDVYTKEQSKQLFYNNINTLLERQLAVGRRA